MAQRYSSSQPWNEPTKRWVLAGVVLLTTILFWRLRELIPPLVIAALLAYVLTPLVGALTRRTRLSRTSASLAVYLLFILLLVALPSSFAPSLLQQIRSLRIDLQDIIQNLTTFIQQYQRIDIFGFPLDLQPFYDELRSQLNSALATLAQRSVDAVAGAFSGILWLIFILIVSFYLVMDGEKLVRHLDRLTPPDYRGEIARLRDEIAEIWNAFLRGQLLLSFSVGLITGLVMWIVGVPNALLLGLLAGILEIIPNLGPVLAAIPAVALAFFQGSDRLPLGNEWFALLVVLLYLVIQQFENYVFVPRILGASVKLHPAVVIAGAVAGASIAGLLGIFLAAPTIASFRLLGGYLYAKILQPNPDPIGTPPFFASPLSTPGGPGEAPPRPEHSRRRGRKKPNRVGVRAKPRRRSR
ncbi:MAG: AI-2E family transporter [Chloroflexi bacterium]|nr:AI-2E family transporter [Chloroflexota bacterium]